MNLPDTHGIQGGRSSQGQGESRYGASGAPVMFENVHKTPMKFVGISWYIYHEFTQVKYVKLELWNVICTNQSRFRTGAPPCHGMTILVDDDSHLTGN